MGIFLNPKTKDMTPRIQEAIDIFLDALNNGTLAKGTCVACAVGNLAAYYTKGEILRKTDLYRNIHFTCSTNNVDWGMLFATSAGIQSNYRKEEDQKIKSIENIPFTIEELKKIEFVFETNTEIDFDCYPQHSPEEIRADQIKGLAAVVKVMLSFDNQEDNVEEVFTSKAELIPI